MIHLVEIKVGPKGKMPTKATEFSAGYDIYSAEEFQLDPGSFKLVSTDLFFYMDASMEAQIRPRSGLALKGITVLNSPGTIDADYHKEVKVILVYMKIFSAPEPIIIRKYDRIAQVVFAHVANVKLEEMHLMETNELISSRTGGFGSTGR